MWRLLCQSLSVRPSATLVSHALAVQDIEICFAPHDKGAFLVSGDQICNTVFRACGRNDCVKQGHPLATAKIAPIIHHISETCKIGRNLLFIHRKSHTCFPLVPKLVTLNDLERRNGRYFALFRGIRPLPRTLHHKILATPMQPHLHAVHTLFLFCSSFSSFYFSHFGFLI